MNKGENVSFTDKNGVRLFYAYEQKNSQFNLLLDHHTPSKFWTVEKVSKSYGVCQVQIKPYEHKNKNAVKYKIVAQAKQGPFWMKYTEKKMDSTLCFKWGRIDDMCVCSEQKLDRFSFLFDQPIKANLKLSKLKQGSAVSNYCKWVFRRGEVF